MTRILVLSNLYPPHHLGGYELSCRDVADRLAARGHDVAVLTTRFRLSDAGGAAGSAAGEVTVRRELAFYWEDHELVSPPLHQRLGMERANQRALVRALDDHRPEVVSVWNMGAMSLGLLHTVQVRGVPMVLAVCDDWLVYGPRLDAWSRLFLRRRGLSRVARGLTGLPTTLADLREAAVCFVSEFVRQRAIEQSPFRLGPTTVVYSGVDLRDFPLAEVGTPRPWRGRLLYVGRLDPRKGVDLAVHALSSLDADTTLTVLGPGSAEQRLNLERLAADLGLAARVRFDQVAREGLRTRYGEADAVLFPPRWDEPFGLVPVESMACGTPVVATATGGSTEFLRHERNCLLVDRDDAVGLADAVRRLASDSPLRARLVAGGLDTARRLDVDRLADVFEAWHVAAARRFVDGLPGDREPLVA